MLVGHKIFARWSLWQSWAENKASKLILIYGHHFYSYHGIFNQKYVIFLLEIKVWFIRAAVISNSKINQEQILTNDIHLRILIFMHLYYL